MKKTEAEFLEEIREIVSKRLKPEKIWLFGSRAGNNGNPILILISLLKERMQPFVKKEKSEKNYMISREFILWT